MSTLRLVGAVYAEEVHRVPGRVSLGVVGMAIRQGALSGHFAEGTEMNTILCSSSG